MTSATRADGAAPIICVEGPSAVGKTTLAKELERVAGGVVVGELDASGAPPIAESAQWFVDRTVERWARARELAQDASLVVLDGDPFKGLWYNAVFADDGWPGVDVIAPLYRHEIERGTLAFPDLYVALDASEAELRERRAGDRTRSRRNFEKHLRLVEPLRGYFAVLAEVAPARVIVVDTASRGGVVETVVARIVERRASTAEAVGLLDHLAAWVARNVG